jgi:SAM-dependent methyltransferase
MRLVELDRHEPPPASGVAPQEHEDLAVDLGDALTPREVLRGVGKRQRKRPQPSADVGRAPEHDRRWKNRSVHGEREPIVDRPYEEPVLAGLYDVLNPWGSGDDYYLELVMSARSVLDLGCGTGQLLRRAAAHGHADVLVGVDPAAAMLAEAARVGVPVTWLQGDAQTIDAGRLFELVTMTGHTFQVFLTDDDVRKVLSNVRRHLDLGGRFAFETRNPTARAWERWTPEHSRVRVVAPSGESVEVAHQLERTIETDLVQFTSTCRFAGGSAPLTSRSTLRFIDLDDLRTMIEDVGFRIDGWFGDWDRTPVTPSPEVIVVATRTR